MPRAALLALALLLATAAPATARLQIGIGEQDPAFFADRRWEALDARHARLVIAWNALTVPWQRAELDAWVAAAERAGAKPLVTFGHARGARERHLPTRAQFARQFRALRRRHPRLRTFQAWNEANHATQPTWRRPQRVARYFDAMHRICARCTITAPSVADVGGVPAWLRRFERAARRPVRIWALHNHIDANRGQSTGTREFLRHTRGKVWFTETGGIADRWVDGKRRRRYTRRNAARATRRILRLAALSRRVRRVYFYHWYAPPERHPRWDSAFIGPGGRARPALRVLRRELRRAR